MEVTGSILHKKIHEIFPDISPNITPEILNRICHQSESRRFLEWFCSHVTRENFLSDEDIQIKQHLTKTNKWLTDDLNAELEQATANCPELRQLLHSKITDETDYNCQYEVEREAYKEDWAYIQLLEQSVKNLKEQEDRVNEDVEQEEIELAKASSELEERYKDCLDLTRDFDEVHRVLYKDVEHLINVYADAAEMKGPAVVWTQMPLELCKTQTEMYINYLTACIKRHFGNTGKDEHINDSDYNTFMEDSRDRRGEEILQELSVCFKNLITSKVEEVTSKASADACLAMQELAVNIYNNGNPKLPQSQAHLEAEVTELIGRRDYLEEKVRLWRENQVEEAVTHSAEFFITEILVLDARLRYERREHRLSSMLRLRELARERGHAHSDLLCMLMELQFNRVMEAVEFVADARYYLSTEYSLSSVRDNITQQMQAEYDAIVSGSPAKRNVYNKIFISMMNGNVNDIDSLAESMRQLKRLVADNEANEEKIFGDDVDGRLNGVISLEDKLKEVYQREINNGRTSSLIQTSFETATRTKEVVSRVSQLQNDVAARRKRLKEKLRKNIDGFEWEKLILWQRFLANPNSVKKVYDDAQKRLEQLHFGTNF
ncbi:uncharacterized protein LOC124187455 [Neodiprion fabricii]|uniref:uncharacterized protein LOC124187455 n=1 Tax=Neodiprion fabricii TaxID=2872261 RepID=UPI001ED92CC6|nr:uncharacterized protein LOC124187455 [Neodiprion fabricii]